MSRNPNHPSGDPSRWWAVTRPTGVGSPADLLSQPLVWAVLVYALLAVGLHARALTQGTIGPVTAAMWSTEVLAATVIGAVALGDHIRRGWFVPAVVGTTVTLLATVGLARSPAQELDHRQQTDSDANE